MARLKNEDFSPALAKAARALLEWTAVEMAVECPAVALRTLRKFESGKDVRDDTRDTIREALEQNGIEFTNGGKPGVRLIGRNLCE